MAPEEPAAWANLALALLRLGDVAAAELALQEAAGLEGSVLLVGNIDRVELWHPARFEEVVSTGAGEFEKFSNQIFG